jgi:hypothetical protein
MWSWVGLSRDTAESRRAIVRVLALRHDPLKPHLAGVRKHERAILVVEVLVEAQPRCRTPEQARERRLAHCERVAPQIVAVEFDQMMQERERSLATASTMSGKR